MRKVIFDVVGLLILALIIGAIVNYITQFSKNAEPMPVAISLEITEQLERYDADEAEKRWLEQFGGMSDEERLFGAVGEPEIIW